VHWGDGQAWLVAEMLHALAHSAATGVHPCAEGIFRAAVRRVFEGQSQQSLAEPPWSTQQVLRLAFRRTGSLIQACVEAPALIAASGFRASLKCYGKAFGIALQIADDIYDFVGSPEVLGKPILGDLLNGQPNFLLAHALSQADSPAKEQITHSFLRGVTDSPSDPAPIVDALRELGSIDFAERLVTRYAIRGRNALKSIPEGPPRILLEGLLDLALALPEKYDH
jgi:octaprenyl-diphosphate synthase